MSLDPVSLGIVLLLTGLVFFLLVWGLPRLISRRRSEKGTPASSPAAAPVEASGHTHAVLIVQPGGRVGYINSAARQWFGLKDGDHPNLEALVRKIRPSEDFMRLCAAESQGRFSVSGRPMEAVSYQIPGQASTLLVSLHRPDFAAVLPDGGTEVSNTAVKILADLSQSVADSLGVPGTIQAILENVERLVPADTLEIKVWDAQEQTLTAYRLGARPGSGRQLDKGLPQPAQGYSAVLVEKRQPLLIADTQKYTEVAQPVPEGQLDPVRSYIGLPLLAGNELIGTLEVSLTRAEAFAQEDLEVLQLVIGQTSAALRNATMLEAEWHRSAELSGLANLAQALGSTRDAHDLFAQLVQSLTPLFDVEILGFLIFDESRRALEAQVPFFGMPAQVVTIRSGSILRIRCTM